jgi:hypothetical protein
MSLVYVNESRSCGRKEVGLTVTADALRFEKPLYTVTGAASRHRAGVLSQPEHPSVDAAPPRAAMYVTPKTTEPNP